MGQVRVGRARRNATSIIVTFVALLVGAARTARADEVLSCVQAAEQAQRLRDEGRLKAARQQFLLCVRASCPAVVRGDCSRWLLELDTIMPRVVVHVEGPRGEDLVDVKVYVDGELVASQLDGRAIFIDPGPHAIRYESALGTREDKILVRENERDRILRVRFDATAPASRPAATEQSPPVPPPPPEERAASTASTPPWAWVLGGTGILAIAGGTYFWVSGRSARGDLENSCAPTHTCTDSQVSGSRNKLIVGDVLFGVGLVAVGVAAYVAIKGTSTPRARAQSVSERPWSLPAIDVAALPGEGVRVVYRSAL